MLRIARKAQNAFGEAEVAAQQVGISAYKRCLTRDLRGTGRASNIRIDTPLTINAQPLNRDPIIGAKIDIQRNRFPGRGGFASLCLIGLEIHIQRCVSRAGEI